MKKKFSFSTYAMIGITLGVIIGINVINNIYIGVILGLLGAVIFSATGNK